MKMDFKIRIGQQSDIAELRDLYNTFCNSISFYFFQKHSCNAFALKVCVNEHRVQIALRRNG